MFYSHEILTDRKHGVATIWLVATIGSKSSLKKITRKAIMEVNVPGACGTITEPSAPIALRLQGKLLVGVSKVFSQQCAYVLTDIQTLRDKMRGISMMLRQLETDPGVTTTRPEQLNLQADLSFNLELDLGFDLFAFDTTFSSSEPSSLLSPRTIVSSQTSFLEHDERMLEMPPPFDQSSSHGTADFLGFGSPRISSIGQKESTTSKPPGIFEFEDEPVAIQEPFFDLAEDGSLILHQDGGQPPISEPGDSDGMLLVEHDDFQLDLVTEALPDLAANAREQSNREESVRAAEREVFEQWNETTQIPAATRSSAAGHQVTESTEQQRHDEDGQQEINMVTGAAPQRSNRTKTVPVDMPAELPNRTLADWNNRYLEIMEDACIKNGSKISAKQAKRNAEYWVLDQGIGGLYANFGNDKFHHPLAVLSGKALLEALHGPPPSTAARKRTRSASTADDEEAHGQARRVRPRSEEGNGNGPKDGELADVVEDEAITPDQEEIEPQMGREEFPPMSEQSESMPWNGYASSRKMSHLSSFRPAMSVAAARSSIGGHAPVDVAIPSSLGSMRISRLIQESPLEQRRRLLRASLQASSTGHRQFEDTRLDDDGIHLEFDDEELDRRLAGDLDLSDNFQLYGPAPAVSTQQATDFNWLADKLEQETFIFLTFLQSTMQAKRGDLDSEEENGEMVITFEELLPVPNNNEIVAAQGFLHVLNLATKGLITVKQEVAFEDIELRVVPGLSGEAEEGNGAIAAED